MKKIWIIVSIILLVAIAGVYTARQDLVPTQSSEASVTKIGLNLALTGSIPYWSTQIKRGMEIAYDEYSKAHPKAPVSLIVEDNQAQANKAIAAFQKLATIDEVSVIVTTHTFISKPQQPLAAQHQLPLLGTIVSAVGFGEVNEWSFLDWLSHQELTPPVARYCYDSLAAKKAATLVVNDDYGLDGAKLFTEYFEKLGGKVVAAETMGNTDSDLRSQITKILQMNPDVIYTVGREAPLISAVKQGREAGFKGTFVGVNAFDSPTVWNGLGVAAEGIIFAGIGAAAETQNVADSFASAYNAKFGGQADWVALYGYSIGQYLFPAAAESGGDRLKLQQILSNLRATTVRGVTTMSPRRNIEMSAVIFARKSGKNVPIEP